jgi:hypothetical protein
MKLDRIQEIDRDTLTQPEPHLPWVTDYIIDCHVSRDGAMHIFAGSNEYVLNYSQELARNPLIKLSEVILRWSRRI